jgi:hypothetical protein
MAKRPKLSINQRAFAAGGGAFLQQFLTPITPPPSPDNTVGQTKEQCKDKNDWFSFHFAFLL